MNLQSRKIAFVQEFLRLEDEAVIADLEELLRERISSDGEGSPMSVKQFNQEIDRSIEDSKNDRVIKARDLKKKIDQWN